jgi:hypothetical protein
MRSCWNNFVEVTSYSFWLPNRILQEIGYHPNLRDRLQCGQAKNPVTCWCTPWEFSGHVLCYFTNKGPALQPKWQKKSRTLIVNMFCSPAVGYWGRQMHMSHFRVLDLRYWILKFIIVLWFVFPSFPEVQRLESKSGSSRAAGSVAGG